MRNQKIVLGVTPTHRNDASFPLERGLYYKKEIFKRLQELGIEYVDLEDVTPNGLLSTNSDVVAAEKKLKEAGVDALFIPFIDFGSEGASCQLAHKLNVPVLMWGPRDYTGQGNDGDVQCGMIAAGKVFRRFSIPFTYFPTCFLEDTLFEKGIKNFIAVANVVKTFRNLYILQIGPRPESFWSVMCNEGELLEKFGIKIYPITISEIVSKTKEMMEQKKDEVAAIVAKLKERANITVKEEILTKSAALKLAMDFYRKETLTNCCAFQCWYALQAELGIWPCTAMSLLNEEGYTCICEGDIHGTISCMLATAATMGRTTPWFGEWCFRHPTIEHAEYVAHCGNCSMDLFKDKPTIGTRCFEFAKDMGGHVCGEIKDGDLTYFRFDGDHGEYSMLLGKAKRIEEGDTCKRGARMWMELPDVRKLEMHVVYGPYIHHCAIIHEDITPVMLEAGKYMNVKPDFTYEEQRKAAEEYLLTESMPNGPAGLEVTVGEPMIG